MYRTIDKLCPRLIMEIDLIWPYVKLEFNELYNQKKSLNNKHLEGYYGNVPPCILLACIIITFSVILIFMNSLNLLPYSPIGHLRLFINRMLKNINYTPPMLYFLLYFHHFLWSILKGSFLILQIK